MNQQEKDSILQTISNIEALNWKEDLLKLDTPIGQYTSTEFCAIIEKTQKIIGDRLVSNEWKTMPTLCFSSYGGSGVHIANQVFPHIYENISKKNWNEALRSITMTLEYCIMNGYWEKISRKLFNEEDLTERKNEIHKLTIELKEKHRELDSITKELEHLKTTKENEFATLKAKQESSIEIESDIQTLHSRIQLTEADINNKQDAIIKHLESSIKTQEEIIEIEKEAKKKAKFIDEVEKRRAEIEVKLSELEKESTKIIELQRKYEDLIGLEATKQLFSKFNERKKELKKPVDFWIWGTFISIVIFAFAVLLFYTDLFGNTFQIELKDYTSIVTGILRMFPFGFLIYFTTRQYQKERERQEQYAFKSAMALTLLSYAEKITDAAVRDKLILDATMLIYKDNSRRSDKHDKNLLGLEEIKNIAEILKTK